MNYGLLSALVDSAPDIITARPHCSQCRAL